MDRKELVKWFELLYMPLGMYALRIVDDIDTAEDLVQDAFIKTLEAIDRSVLISDPKAWMYRSVRNECISYLRRRKVSVDISEIEDQSDVSDETIEDSERDARVWRAVDALPDRCREIFLMSKRDGMSGEEIAEELGVSVKTVRNQLTKAMSRMRDALADRYKPFFLPFL